MSIRSMTGFARIRKSAEVGELMINLKSVNHRGLDIHFHMPPELEAFESALRSAVKRRAARGHFQVRVTFNRYRPETVPIVNRPMLEAYVTAFRLAAEQNSLDGEPDLNAALTIPGMFREATDEEPNQQVEDLLLPAFEEALESLSGFREREGNEIAAELRTRVAAIREAVSRMEEIRGRAVPAFQARLSERLKELLEGAPVEPLRLAQEVALMADRSDIGEELARLKIHAAQLEDLLDGGGEIGKKMDFLLQEMNRETNTILSKATGAAEPGLAITDLALATKADIEKIREQSLNVE
jgi:uncharacterized protein (TIGR00255 family)